MLYPHDKDDMPQLAARWSCLEISPARACFSALRFAILPAP